MPQEIWRDTEYPNYQVSNLGRVYSVPRIESRGGFLSKNNNGRGYMTVMLSIGGKQKRVYNHRLVARAFIPNPENKPEVNHKDGNKQNNCVENLEWVTRTENATHLRDTLGYKRPNLTQEQKDKISNTIKNLWRNGTYANKKRIEYTEEFRNKCSIAQLNSKNKKRGAQHPMSKPVLCIETGKVYECIKYAAKDIGCSSWTITDAATRHRPYKGLHWEFVQMG